MKKRGDQMSIYDFNKSVPKKNIFNSSDIKVNENSYKESLEKRQENEQRREAQKLGLNLDNISKTYDTIENLIKVTPGMVTAEVVTNSTMNMKNKKMNLKKGSVYIMSYGTYMMSYRDRFRGSKILKPHNKQFKKLFKRYKGQDLNNKKLLVWRSGGIGDIMFSQPVIKYLKEKYPNSKIIYGTAYHNISIFDNWPKGLINKVIHIPFEKKDLLSANYHLTFEGSIERCKEAEEINCYDIFRKVANLDFDPSNYPIELIPNQDIVDRLKDKVPENTVMIHMRASAALRMMSSENWKEIVDGLEQNGYNVAVIDSYNMGYIYDRFKEEQNLPNLINLSEYSTSLNEGIAMLSLCKGLIAIDSSFTHLAAGLNVPVVGIYGPFLGKLRMQYYKNSDWVDSTDYDGCGLWPCFFHQHKIKECPFIAKNSLPGCLSSIEPTTVVDVFKKLMEKQDAK